MDGLFEQVEKYAASFGEVAQKLKQLAAFANETPQYAENEDVVLIIHDMAQCSLELSSEIENLRSACKAIAHAHHTMADCTQHLNSIVNDDNLHTGFGERFTQATDALERAAKCL